MPKKTPKPKTHQKKNPKNPKNPKKNPQKPKKPQKPSKFQDFCQFLDFQGQGEQTFTPMFSNFITITL